MINIVLFGGSFNPIGNHHITIANHLSTLFDEVWILPTYVSNSEKILENEYHRMEMCKIAIANNNNHKLKLCDYEISHKIIDKTIGFITKFIEEYSESNSNIKFHYAIGADNALTIHSWDEYEKLLKLMPFIVIPRKGYNTDDNYWFNTDPHIFLRNINPTNFSSTKIRSELKYNLKPCDIDNDVYSYIIAHNLYK